MTETNSYSQANLCRLQRFICTLTWSCAGWKPWIWWTMFWRTGRSLWIFLGPFGWMHWIGQDQPKTGLSVCMSWNICFWICWATWTSYWNTERCVSTSWALCTLMTHICGCFSRPEMDWRCYRANAKLLITTMDGLECRMYSRMIRLLFGLCLNTHMDTWKWRQISTKLGACNGISWIQICSQTRTTINVMMTCCNDVK